MLTKKTDIGLAVDTLRSGSDIRVELDLAGYELLRDVFTLALHHTDSPKQHSDFRRLWGDIASCVKNTPAASTGKNNDTGRAIGQKVKDIKKEFTGKKQPPGIGTLI